MNPEAQRLARAVLEGPKEWVKKLPRGENYDQAIQLVQNAGFEASYEFPGVIQVRHDGREWVFGTANGPWGYNEVTDDHSQVLDADESDLPDNAPGIRIADYIISVVRRGDRVNPQGPAQIVFPVEALGPKELLKKITLPKLSIRIKTGPYVDDYWGDSHAATDNTFPLGWTDEPIVMSSDGWYPGAEIIDWPQLEGGTPIPQRDWEQVKEIIEYNLNEGPEDDPNGHIEADALEVQGPEDEEESPRFPEVTWEVIGDYAKALEQMRAGWRQSDYRHLFEPS